MRSTSKTATPHQAVSGLVWRCRLQHDAEQLHSLTDPLEQVVSAAHQRVSDTFRVSHGPKLRLRQSRTPYRSRHGTL